MALTAEQQVHYSSFLQDEFDTTQWANAVLGTESSQELGAALNRLNGGIDDLNRQLRTEITTHHSQLLSQAAAMTSLNDSLAKVQSGLAEVEGGVARLRLKIAAPYEDLAASIDRLTRLSKAEEVTQRAARLVHLAKRLEAQMSELESSKIRDRSLAEAALLLSEIDAQSQEQDGNNAVSLRSIPALEPHLDAIDASRDQITSEMEDMVREGLSSFNQAMLASSLQTAANLAVLPSMVSSLVSDLTEAVELRIRATFDMHSIARELSSKEGSSSFEYKSRARTEPTNVTLPQWTNSLWSRLEGLIKDMADCCIKVYLLEQVLELKKDQQLQCSFLSLCMQTLESKPSLIFWTTLASTFESQVKELVKASTFAQQTLGQGYPKLLRLFQDFFNEIALHTDTVYTHTRQSPETVLLLRAVLPFESIYLSRSNSRLNEAVAAALQGGTRTPPGANEGLVVARAMCNELDSARFDPLLVRNVARNVARAMELFIGRMDTLIAADYSAISLIGPVSPPSQTLNAELANALYHFWHPINRIIETDFTPETSVPDIVQPALVKARNTLFSIIAPLLTAIRRELSNIIARMHRIDYDKPSAGDAGTSTYMKDFGDKLAYIRLQVLDALRIGTLSRESTVDLARFLIDNFILHASIIKPLSEQGKLQLLSDLTALEFSVSQLLSDFKLGLNALGQAFTELRSFRTLLFAETSELADNKHIQSMPVLPLLHHIIVRSPLSLPHQLHGWSEAEYVKWINEHADSEKINLINGVIADWEETQQGHCSEGSDFVSLLRQVIQQVGSPL